MSAGQMHADEQQTDAILVRRLLTAHFPQWADQRIERVASAGTDNALYRLGDDLVVRLPRIGWAADDVDKEQRWLPELAPHLPLDIPVPVGLGHPAEGYPWRWSVYRWLDGEAASLGRLHDLHQAASDLAGFVTALHAVDSAGGPTSGGRGAPLESRDDATRAAIASLDGLVDTMAVTRAWESSLREPLWEGPPVWVHGDLNPGNLLVRSGRLSAVIDFGALNVGDPAVDLLVAWNFLPAAARKVYRTGLGVDDATWGRGRGWALSVALIALPYYLHTNPVIVASSRHVIAAVLADAGQS